MTEPEVRRAQGYSHRILESKEHSGKKEKKNQKSRETSLCFPPRMDQNRVVRKTRDLAVLTARDHHRATGNPFGPVVL